MDSTVGHGRFHDRARPFAVRIFGMDATAWTVVGVPAAIGWT